MSTDWNRTLREAIENAGRIQQPPTRPNRTLLSFFNPTEPITIQETLTASATAIAEVLPEWGTTTDGPGGGNFQYAVAGPWR